MEITGAIVEKVLRYASTIRLTDWVDIALMAYGIYVVLKLVGQSRAASVGRGVLIFLVALGASDFFKLNSVYFILRNIVTWGVLALLIIFQPEIRRMLEQLGSSKLTSLNPFAKVQQAGALETAISQTVDACTEMSASRTGVLIVFERENKLDDIARTGTIVDAQVSVQLLKNIFFVKAAMHDGACIVRDGRLYAGGCQLPLTHNPNISRDLGMRHRAGIGMSENSDAVVVIVSEETGAISVAIRGMLKRHLTAQTLETLLHNELMPATEDDKAEKKKLRLPQFRNLWNGKEADEHGNQ